MKIFFNRKILGIVPPILVLGFVYLNISSDNLEVFMNKELSIAHSPIESRCELCHEFWYGVYNDLCSKCHLDECYYYNDLIKENESYAKKTKCFDCHRHHQGRSSNLIPVDDYICDWCDK
jgi:hypothetical protein